MPIRRIAHVDLDAFYASVEQRDDPALRGKPVAVGGRTRGVVMAASYEARAYGVRSAMPVAHARRVCPSLVSVKPRFDAYLEASDAFHSSLATFATARDRVGLDEAYLDLSHHPPPARPLGEAIRAAVHHATGLTCSVGISSSRFVAKVASDHEKPDGLTVIHPNRVVPFLAALPVERFHGVGPATAARLRKRGYRTGADLQSAPPGQLEADLGRTGRWLARIAFGQDDRPVGVSRRRKSAGAERTFFNPLYSLEEINDALDALAHRVAQRLAKDHLAAHTVTVKARSPAFRTVTRQASVVSPVWTGQDLAVQARTLIHTPSPLFSTYRLLGVAASSLVEADGLVVARQLEFEFPGDASTPTRAQPVNAR